MQLAPRHNSQANLYINNDRCWTDPLLSQESSVVRASLSGIVEQLNQQGMKVKTLNVFYTTIFDGEVGDLRCYLDETADSDEADSDIEYVYIYDQKKRGLFKFQTCLEPLKILTARIKELSIRGDISQAYIDEVIAAI